MLGRACLSTSWISKAWKPAARRHTARMEPPQTAVHLPLERRKGVESYMEQTERFGVPRPGSPRDGTTRHPHPSSKLISGPL